MIALERVGSFPMDESPYGVRDMGGSMAEWCEDSFIEIQGAKHTRGGKYLSNPNGSVCGYSIERKLTSPSGVGRTSSTGL